MGWLSQRIAAANDALGFRRYLLAPLFGAVVVFVDWVLSRLDSFGLSDLFGIPSWAIGLIAMLGFVVVLLVDHIAKLRGRLSPRLRIRYDDAAPDCHKPVYHSADGGRTGHSGHSIRLRVECDSDASVEHCSGFLTKIEYRTSGGAFTEVPLYEPTYLHWALEEPNPFEPVSVYPRVPRYLGICRTEEPLSGFRIRTKHRSFVTPERFDNPGDYRISIEVVAAQSAPRSATMLIVWNGKWNEIKASLLDE